MLLAACATQSVGLQTLSMQESKHREHLTPTLEGGDIASLLG